MGYFSPMKANRFLYTDKKVQNRSMNRKAASQIDDTKERLQRFHVRHITDPEELARIQAEYNYQPPSNIAPKFNPNPENWDFS